MTISPYDSSLYDYIAYMLETQDYNNTVIPGDMPEIGFVVSEGSIPVAAGFLRLMEGRLAQIDGLCSNATLDSSTRHEAVSLVVDSLICKAKSLKLKGIIAYTKDESVVTRAEATGFKVLPHVVLSIPLD